MIIYPAIDLRGGKVVRLKEGDPNQQTTFSDDPIATAQQWIEAGAEWIHMVNLDGAFSDANDNGAILAAAAALGKKIQFGGGLRSMADIEQAIEQGASRVVLGTVAVKNPEIVAEAVMKFGPDVVCVALDAKDGVVTTHGWTEQTEITPTELGKLMAEKGVRHALFTDVSRDGKLSGVNIEATAALGRDTGLQVIASGGVSTLEEIQQLKASQTVAGAVIGMALYEERITLQDAIAAAKGAS
ncbi:MAG: 1-(5-phosphoribosyl)-5-[(5-phosphoribosylamino)methylideneamino]imidazole-4-carboxamide isomerase [Chloroflexota bacterium]